MVNSVLLRVHPDVGVIYLQEINIDISQSKVYKRVWAVVDAQFSKQAILVCSTTTIRSATDWQPGSTLIIVTPVWAPNVIGSTRGDLGRWCSVTLQGQNNNPLAIYSFHNC